MTLPAPLQTKSKYQILIGIIILAKSSSGNFVALRVDRDLVDDGVLIVFTKENLRKGIRDGGRVMNPLG